MSAVHSQDPRTVDRWNAAPMRAAGLYGELPTLPLPVPPPLSAAPKPQRSDGRTG